MQKFLIENLILIVYWFRQYIKGFDQFTNKTLSDLRQDLKRPHFLILKVSSFKKSKMYPNPNSPVFRGQLPALFIPEISH